MSEQNTRISRTCTHHGKPIGGRNFILKGWARKRTDIILLIYITTENKVTHQQNILINDFIGHHNLWFHSVYILYCGQTITASLKGKCRNEERTSLDLKIFHNFKLLFYFCQTLTLLTLQIESTYYIKIKFNMQRAASITQ